MLVKNYPSVWILDPYAPSQLPWKIIERIAGLRGKRSKNDADNRRRPELIINLMSSYLQRFSETQPEITSIALGRGESDWKSSFLQYKKEYGNVREAILRLYFDQLNNLYGRDPVFILVREITNRAVVYAMLLCSTNDAGYYLMLTRGLPQFREYQVEVWRKNAKKILLKRAIPSQKFIDDFLKIK